MKKTMAAAGMLAVLLLLCACGKESGEVPSVPSAAVGDKTVTLTTPADELTLPDTSAEPTESGSGAAPTTAAPVVSEALKNEYNAAGKPLTVYEVVGSGADIAYTGVFTTFVYTAAGNVSEEKTWTEAPDGGELLTDAEYYTYDGAGHLTASRAEKRGNDGEMTVRSRTAYTCDAGGNILSAEVSQLSPDGSILSSTHTEYAYDAAGNEVKADSYDGDTLLTRTETVYVYNPDGSVQRETVTRTQNAGTSYESAGVAVHVYDADGNLTESTFDDGYGVYTYRYTYDTKNRELSATTFAQDGAMLDSSVTVYTDYADGSYLQRTNTYASDGSLSDSKELYFDAYGNPIVPNS